MRGEARAEMGAGVEAGAGVKAGADQTWISSQRNFQARTYLLITGLPLSILGRLAYLLSVLGVGPELRRELCFLLLLLPSSL